MKKFLITVLAITALACGAYLKDIPMTVAQPDGTELNLFATGDEFFNRLHDENDFTVIQGDDGWYYYGVENGGEVIPSAFKAFNTDPASAGLIPGAKISEEIYKKRVASFNNFTVPKDKDAPTTGTINNLCVFIRFSDESESIFNRQRSFYDAFFNKADGPSLGHYFNEVSYEKLTVNSVYYPHVDDFTTNLSYQDIYPRSYYKPYNATSNPNGYQGGDHGSERTEREQSLLERAVLAIAGEVPTDLVIDSDKDGYVDNIVFLISGGPGAWASLLWPHRWSLYTKDVVINRKKVWDYNFNLTGTTSYFTVGVIAHEFFHTLGAPDLYHYYNDTAPDAVGAWDIMNSTSNPPQYMGAWMKYKYGDWIDSVPVISSPGVYTLKPLQSPTGNIYRINSPNSVNEFFVLEYRMQTGLYETGLPGSDNGILIYRINSSYNGNADGPPDEVYVFRPNGTLTANGTINSALFSKSLGRTEFNMNANPYPFLSNGSAGGINITKIGTPGTEITFEIALNVLPPKNIVSSFGYGSVELNWQAPDPVSGHTVSYYKVYRNGVLVSDNVTQTKYIDTQVIADEVYKYSVSAYYTGVTSGESSYIETENLTYKAPYPLPYTTDYTTQTGWTQISVECTPRWISSNSAFAGGTAPEMMAVLENFNPAVSRYVSPPVSTAGIDTLLISFKHFYDGFEPGVTYKVQVSSNKTDWTDTSWSFAGTESDAGPETVNIELTTFPDPVYVAWVLDGNQWSYDAWYLDDISLSRKTPSSIEDGSFPAATKLNGNYPNPFNPETVISFDLSKVSDVKLAIYDIKGALVRTLISEKMKAGSHRVQWDGRDDLGQGLSSGVFYISLKAGDKVMTHRSLMIK
jgi:M6 family metalloprotease-like protein